MDHETFDSLTRFAAADGGTRRGLLRLLAGSALGSVAARLGLSDDATAKTKRHGKRRHDHQPARQVQAAAKKRKNKNKDKRKDKDKPPTTCKPGSRPCSNGNCIADLPHMCCMDEEFCPGGGCRAKNECCSGDRQCYGTTTCVKPNECCPAEKKCGDGECYPQDGCCPGQKNCGGGVCVAPNECCELTGPLCADECAEAVCVNGEWKCRSECTGDKTCCMGVCLPPCPNGCNVDENCAHCTEPPVGKVYCEGQDRCVDACGSGQRLHPDTCKCIPTGPTCRPNHQDCRRGDVCCDGHCIPCPDGGICADGVCLGCVSPNSVSCPSNPYYPYGHCCPPQDAAGRPFNYCHIPGEPNSGSWGCYYKYVQP